MRDPARPRHAARVLFADLSWVTVGTPSEVALGICEGERGHFAVNCTKKIFMKACPHWGVGWEIVSDRRDNGDGSAEFLLQLVCRR